MNNDKKQKNINALYKEIGISKNATKQEIKAKLLDYMQQNKNIYKFQIDDEILNDPKFLLDAYNKNAEMTRHLSPDPDNENLQLNADFMIEYVKLALKHRVETVTYFDTRTNLKWIVEDCVLAMENPKFTAALINEFPNIDILDMIKYDVLWNDIETFQKIVSKLPKEVLVEQAKKYGRHFIVNMPKSLDCFVELISASIEKDGFNSLELLNISEVLNNKNLVVKAYKKNGLAALKKYINGFLRPEKSKSAITTYQKAFWPKYTWDEYVKKCENLRTELLGDTKIHYIFKMEEKLAKDKKQMQQKLAKERKDFEDSL